MKYFDIRSNQIVLRFLDNLLVTAGYKCNLEYLGIEDNKKAYQVRNAVCSCLMIRTGGGGSSTLNPENDPNSELAYTKVSPI